MITKLLITLEQLIIQERINFIYWNHRKTCIRYEKCHLLFCADLFTDKSLLLIYKDYAQQIRKFGIQFWTPQTRVHNTVKTWSCNLEKEQQKVDVLELMQFLHWWSHILIMGITLILMVVFVTSSKLCSAFGPRCHMAFIKYVLYICMTGTWEMLSLVFSHIFHLVQSVFR